MATSDHQKAEGPAVDEPSPTQAQNLPTIEERQKTRLWRRERFVLAVLVLFTGFFGAYMIEDVIHKRPMALRADLGHEQSNSDGAYDPYNFDFYWRVGRVLSAYGACHLSAVHTALTFWPKLRADGTEIIKHHWVPRRIIPMTSKQRRATTMMLMAWFAYFGEELRLLAKVFVECWLFFGGEPGGSLAQVAKWASLTVAAYSAMARAAWEVAPVVPF